VINVHFVYLGAAIGAVGSLAYMRDTLRGTTQPNRVTWLLWAFAPLLASAVELRSGVGLRTLTTFMIGFMPLLVFVASFHNPASVWKIRRLDYACGAMSLAGTAAWLATQNGVVAIAAAIAADFTAGLPTMIKSWSHPQSESVSSYVGAVLNAGILLLTVVHWTTEVAAFPLFILCVGSVQVLLVGGRVGPRLRHALARRRAAGPEPAPTS
jgi:dolichol kinase